ncbi:MAG: alpha/beta hydrolase, partial [Pseudomonadota bacterium]
EAACAFGQAAASAPAGGPRTDDPPPGAAPDDPMTHDAARSQRFTELVAAAPGARLGRPTFGWLRAAFRASWSAMRPASLRRLTTPMLIVSPRSDVLIDARSHDDLVCDAPKARLQRAPGARHELLMETDELRAIFWQAFDAFITDLEAARAMRGPEPGPHAAGPAAS